MKKNNKAIKKKASIFRMYGKYFLLFIVDYEQFQWYIYCGNNRLCQFYVVKYIIQ